MTLTLSRILVPTDFSISSESALEYAKMFAVQFGASLHLLHVIEDPAMAGLWGSEFYVAEFPRLREAIQREARARLDQMLTVAKRERLDASTEIADGPVAKTIVDIGRQQRADLIVMGTHGRRGVAHLLLGSVADKVIRTAECPVLTIRVLDADVKFEPR